MVLRSDQTPIGFRPVQNRSAVKFVLYWGESGTKFENEHLEAIASRDIPENVNKKNCGGDVFDLGDVTKDLKSQIGEVVSCIFTKQDDTAYRALSGIETSSKILSLTFTNSDDIPGSR